MSPAELVLVVATGLAAGVLSSTVGVASLLSFPVLVGLGLPPVVANVSNTMGLIPGGLGGVVGYRQEVREAGRVAYVIMVVCGLGAILGAALLIGLPPGVFEAIVPYLILFTCLLVGIQPRIAAWLRARHETRHGVALAERRHMSPLTTVFATITGVYGGYFGAGAGVMMVAVLGIGTDLELRVVNGLKTLSLMVGNIVAGAIFAVVADPRWDVVVLLAAGSLVGGYVGARIGRKLPDAVFRGAVVAAGVVAALLLF
ncbi:sulfite exporter TauE/SafE family protein [Nocardioides sp. zg-1228]|uniref:sulfite exporter TauE/SafE family protein n=1 Tax=Nocardioides sp. zg-1228 TaxID=2763008 RepID=UPI00164321D3|nr:sulfite exporter TauE/SafE family protein [Nocardioides sp. zg-1228]MBC2933018.1 sulfite exporter TauE/SafE family protein [Nocardioides sp. zg-1228]QSF56787.1 sulfite exporter TauE/SafE family protein [Nocardioides sp. zg-1228]